MEENKWGSNETYFPKVGEEKKFAIKTITKVEEAGNPKNFSDKNKKDYGHYYSIILQDGSEAILNTWALLKKFRELNVKEGDTIIVKHPGKGEYEVTKDTWEE